MTRTSFQIYITMHLFITLISLLSALFGNDEAEIVFVGDAMMHQAQIEAARREDAAYDFSEYFASVDSYFKSADYAVANLETPVSDAPFSGYPCFNAPAEYLDALHNAGFDLLLTANNHTLDRRDKGVAKTIENLDKRKISHIGTYINDSSRRASLPFIRNINGIKTAFLNYTYGTNGIAPGPTIKVDYIDTLLIRNDVNQARQAGAEIIFACVHWGNEYQLTPHPAQKKLAEFLFDTGVDAVIGGHPHVVQPFEFSDGKLLVYSLGNFISNMKTRDTRGGAVVKVSLRRDDDGKARIEKAVYRLVYTEPADNTHNFRLKWADESNDPRSGTFAAAARSLFSKYNVGVNEDLPDKQKE